MNYKKYLFIGLLLIGLALAVAACSTTATPCPECAACPEAPACPEALACPEAPTCPTPVVETVPYEEEWANSPHSDDTAEAFRHWDEDDPQEVPTSCAQCHTPTGYMDYLGADGSAAGVVDAAQPVSNGITCDACHNDAAVALSEVTFPSGAVVSSLGPEARCMVCHQGRASGASIDNAIATNVLTDTLDTVSTELRFTNIHYFAAAATLYGTEVKGGYEYAGNTYDGKFQHVDGVDTCVSCHDQHTLELRIEKCQECHTNVSSREDLANIRMNGSEEDYNGNGDVTEGISAEISGLQGFLMTGVQAYAKQVAGAPIAYDPASYPYFFNDANDNGVVDAEETSSDTAAYASWTARLLKAAYNYQLSVKDPGAFAHNAKYVVQLLYDSIADLNTQLSTPIDMSALHRIDAGHFAGTEMAFRDWDAEGEVPATCSRCHSAEGLPLFLKEAAASSDGVTGVTIAQPVSQGFECHTCHDVTQFPATYAVDGAKFPSGAVLTFGEGAPANLCITCHQGRQSTVSIDKAIGDAEADAVVEGLTFRNPHYFAAGATLFGTDAKGAYEYAGQTYLGPHPHVTEFSATCVSCHNAHELGINTEFCTSCHGDTEPEAIRKGETDYDGDGDTSEGMSGEVATVAELLIPAIQKYAAEKLGTAIAYDPASYPYFFIDTNANGVVDPEEAVRENGYATWSPRLLRAAYNYQWVQKDPGAFAHNGNYILEVMYDSLKDLGADVTTLTRP